MFGPSFQNRQMPDAVKGFVFDSSLPAILGLIFFQLHQFVHDELPVARCDLRVTRRQIRASDSQIYGGLMGRLVPDVNEAQGIGLGFRAQAGLFAGGRVLALIHAGALKQNEPILHVMPFWF